MTVQPLSPSLLTASESDVIVAANLSANRHERAAYDALDQAGKDACLSDATALIASLSLRGIKAEESQRLPFPRLDRLTYEMIDFDSDEADGDYAVPGIPRGVRIACALLAATLASRDAGTDPIGHVHEAAAAGINSQSGRSGGEGYGSAARSTWAMLPLRVQRRLSPYRRRGGSLV